jgi:hypothetical protein
MRKLAFVLLIATAACGKNPSTGGDDTMSPDADMTGSNAGTPAFEIKSTDILLPQGAEFTKCFYFHTSNTAPVAVDKWISDMTPGSHHLILFLNPGGSQPADGTIDENCSVQGTGGSIAQWTFAAASEHYELDLPSDDGAGKPLAQLIPAGTAGYVQMHYLNASDTDKMVHVDVKAYAVDATQYTQTAPYITYTFNFQVPPGTSTITGSCPAPTGTKFWQVSSHTHKQGTEVKISDGTSMIYDSTDWEHPMVKVWSGTPFYTFSDKVNWACSYNNPTSATIKEGQSAAMNEMCMATGYYFPATAPSLNGMLYSNTNQPQTCITR